MHLCLRWRSDVRMGWMSGRSGCVRNNQRKQPSGRSGCWTYGWHHNGGGSLEAGRKRRSLVLVGWKKPPAEHVGWQGPRPRGKWVRICPAYALTWVLEQYHFLEAVGTVVIVQSRNEEVTKFRTNCKIEPYSLFLGPDTIALTVILFPASCLTSWQL